MCYSWRLQCSSVSGAGKAQLLSTVKAINIDSLSATLYIPHIEVQESKKVI